MKTIILAGGWGTRLGQVTENIPKPMVMVGEYPIVWHIMKHYAHYGFKDFVISAGVKAQVIKEYFLNFQFYSQDFIKDLATGEIEIVDRNSDLDWRVSIIDTGVNTLKGARIKRLEKYLNGPVHMVTYGDSVSDIDIGALMRFHKSHGKTITISGVHPPARFGEIREKNAQVISFEEKPQTSSGMINGGFMVFNKNLLDHLTIDEKCDFEFGVFQKLVSCGEVMVFKHSGNWECVDHGRDLVHLNKLWDEGRAFWKVWE